MMMRCHRYAPFSPCRPIATTLRVWLGALGLLLPLAAGQAGAECVLVGSTVTCTGSDPDGFDAGGTGDLQVDVLPDASVDNGGAAGVSALNLASDNVVDVQAGVDPQVDAQITTSGVGAHGIAAGERNTITNAGAILVTGDASRGISVGDDNDDITNSGSIEASGAGGIGISAGAYTGSGSAPGITNSGSIEVSGAGGVGISVDHDSNVTNDGTITVSNAAGGMGLVGQNHTIFINDGTIALSGGDNVGALGANNTWFANQGSITAQDANSVGLAADSQDSDLRNNLGADITLDGDNSVAIRVADDNFAAYNQGTITLNGAGSTGIQVGNDNDNVWNAGTLTVGGDDGIGMDGGDGNDVTNSDTLEVTGASGIGIRFGDGNTVTNSGTVTTSGSDGVGVLLGTAAGTAGNTLTNSGTITGGDGSGGAVSFAPSGSGTTNILDNQTAGVIDGSASNVAILGSAGVEQITHEGTITGDVQLGAGDDVFAMSTGAVLNGAVDAGGDSDTLRLEGSGTDALDLSTLSNFEALDVSAAGGTWMLSGSGSFSTGTTVTNGTLGIDQELDLSGDYVQASGTSLLVRLDPDGPDVRLDVDGEATIESGATLEVEAVAPLNDATTYTFLTATGGLTGLFDETNFPDDTGVLSFSQVATSNSLSIELSRVAYASVAGTDNQTATAIHLDDILAQGPTGDMATVLANLDMLSASELQAAYDALHPEVYDAQANAILSFGRSVTELAAFRRPRCEEIGYERRPEIAVASPCSAGWMPWASAFGLFAERDGDTGHIDFSHSGGGLLLGADHPVGEHFLLYGFLGGGYAGIDLDGMGDGTLYSATAGAGARWNLGGSRIHGLVGYARGWHEQERDIAFGGISRTAEADYGSNLILGFVKAGHTFRLGNLDFEPLATVEYGYLMEQSFEESGAGDIDLDVDERTNSVLSTTVGGRLAYTFFKWEYMGELLEWADGVWTPEISARWRGNWIGNERDFDARMVGAPAAASGFTVEGKDAEQGLQAGAGLAFRPLRAHLSIRADYDGFYGDGSMIHRVGASIRIPLGGPAR